MKNFIAIIVLSCAVSACATVAVQPPGYRDLGTVAGVEVRVYSSYADLLRGLPPLVAAFFDTISRIYGRQWRLGGYYDQDKKIIHVLDNPASLVHEFKHHLEPSWVHGFPIRPEDQGWRQVGPDKMFTLRGREFPVGDRESVESVMSRFKEIYD